MTTNERIQAVVDFGFTERQARFLVLVMRHAGVCVPRQYARFAGVAHGAKCNAFFNKLVRRGYAVAYDCIHNRARLYHVHHKPLYHVIGEVTSRYRRRVPPRLAIERLMLLDAVLSTPDLEWLTTVSEKGAYLARLRELPGVQTAPPTPADAMSRTGSQLSAAFPIGLERDGRVVLLYLGSEPWTDGFRSFLQAHAGLLRVAPTWTLRLVFPRPLDRVYGAYQAVAREELESPLRPATINELRWYFEHRREAAARACDMARRFECSKTGRVRSHSPVEHVAAVCGPLPWLRGRPCAQVPSSAQQRCRRPDKPSLTSDAVDDRRRLCPSTCFRTLM